MELKEIIGLGMEIFLGVGALAAGIGYLIYGISKSGRQEKSEVITSADTVADFWKQQANEFKEMMKVKDEKHTTQINELTREVGELRGQLNSEKTQNERLERIFQNRNPEMEQFMKSMIKAAEDHDYMHQEMMRVLGEIHKYAKDEHTRELHIDATISKDGQK